MTDDEQPRQRRNQVEHDENTEFQPRQRRNGVGKGRRDFRGFVHSDDGIDNRMSGEMGDSRNTESRRYQTEEVQEDRKYQSRHRRNGAPTGRGDDSDSAFSDNRFDRRKNSGMRGFRNTQSPPWSEKHQTEMHNDRNVESDQRRNESGMPRNNAASSAFCGDDKFGRTSGGMRNSRNMREEWSQWVGPEDIRDDSEFSERQQNRFVVDIRECPASMKPSDFYMKVTNAYRRFQLKARLNASPELKLEGVRKRYELAKRMNGRPGNKQKARRQLESSKPVNDSPEDKRCAPSTQLELSKRMNSRSENEVDLFEHPAPKSPYYYRKKWSVQEDTRAYRGASLSKTIKEATALKRTGGYLIQPNRKMRKRLGILPHDPTHKRMEDDIYFKESTKNGDQKKTSSNALFRAIKPSSSILSFIENNLLGRRRHLEWRRAGYNLKLKSLVLDNVPYTKNVKRDPIEQPVFRNLQKLCTSARVASSFPSTVIPEIAFGGRSNVGKSSLLNAITRRWTKAETSDKPGLTQTIDFYDVGPTLRLVDLPGYGFAYAKDEVKDAWHQLVKHYVTTRPNLRRVCLLVDTKWGLKSRDHELIHLMDTVGTRYQIVLTKTDLVFPEFVAKRAMQIEEMLKERKAAVQPLMMVSSKSGAGIRALRTVLSKIARLPKLRA